MAWVWCLCRSQDWGQVLTCRDEKDACAKDDIVSAAVELAGCHTEPAEEEQCDAEDGEDAGGPDDSYEGKRRGGEGEREGVGGQRLPPAHPTPRTPAPCAAPPACFCLHLSLP